jgi:hypothetical protein
LSDGNSFFSHILNYVLIFISIQQLIHEDCLFGILLKRVDLVILIFQNIDALSLFGCQTQRDGKFLYLFLLMDTTQVRRLMNRLLLQLDKFQVKNLVR